jgi:Bacterial SH3 domain
MIRHAAATAIAICLCSSSLEAQTTEFTVKVQSAPVRKAPSTGSPVIGEAPRGAVLEVTRDIGAWVKVTWPDAQDRIGYVHQTMGSLTHRSTLEERVAAAFPASAAPVPASPAATDATAIPSGPAPVPMSTRAVYVAPSTHVFGLGARVGSLTGSTPEGFGISSRVWSRKRFGLQVEAARSKQTSTTAPGRLTSMEIAPSFVYSLPDSVSDYVWLRPYVGTGATFYRSTFKSGTPDPDLQDNTIGLRTFGGAELTFAGVPRFAVSADLGYLWAETPFPGFELGGLGFSISGHWYVK